MQIEMVSWIAWPCAAIQLENCSLNTLCPLAVLRHSHPRGNSKTETNRASPHVYTAQHPASGTQRTELAHACGGPGQDLHLPGSRAAPCSTTLPMVPRPRNLRGAFTHPAPDPVVWVLVLDLKGKMRGEPQSPSLLFSGWNPVYPLPWLNLFTLLWRDPGSVIHGLEEVLLQPQEVLVQVLPGVSAQQELEDAPLGYGIILFHVTGDVTATGR